MDNNTKLISSITIEKDFEQLIKMYVKKVYDADAYLVGGPWDNGKDLVLSKRGREIKEALQISIQEKKIETKVEDDVKKILNLVDNHNYPPILNFFWNQPISEYYLDKIKTHIRNEYAITLEFYDAKRISQDITDNYPDILSYLMKDIHHYDFDYNDKVNIQQRAFYEYLLLSKDSTDLKNVIIDANIMSNLYEEGKSLKEIELDLEQFKMSSGSIKGRLQRLIKSKKVILNKGVYILSDRENQRIENVKTKELSRKNETLELISAEIEKYTDNDISREVFDLITKAYEESLNIQLAENNFETPKTTILKTTFSDLKKLLKSKCNLSDDVVNDLAGRLIEMSAKNDYLSEHCSAKLCVNLLGDRKLEKYIENKKFFIYLDAPVLIPYLLTITFKNSDLFDKSLSNVDFMRSHIDNLNNKRLRVSNEHFEEAVRHLVQAKKLSDFVTRELVDELGESKNVYFNVFIRWLDTQPSNVTFDDFIYAFLGLDNANINGSNAFDTYSNYIYDLLESANFDIIDYSREVDNAFLNKIRGKYVRELKSNRNYRSIDNDIICDLYLSDEKFHLDENGYFSAPMLITLDSYQYGLRNIIRKEIRYAEWLVYTPQRAIERLSLVGLKLTPECIKDSVLAAISDEYFFKENSTSLLDTLSMLVDGNEVDKSDMIKFVTQLKRKVTEELEDKREIDIEKYNNISYVLLYIHKEFRDEFSKVVKLFNSSDLRSDLSKLLLDSIGVDFNQDSKDKLSQGVKRLLSLIE
ncbi:TPA: hypothetical protein NJY97_002681 [Vibrio parahaemolyticus]|nr:hypothetical protein [Vibrio parahaemolyticus]HCE1607950.1 hypothetical protein [Vibrio parahaemolyticus]HCE5230888.1 hypothetical protein [Vibrio parahaemolyticus]HCG5109002.1 hypothetical protein [Vibrio parahaemolyticus]HCG5119515.1 hypothetical protein [Vibrio parahaemolyticus]